METFINLPIQCINLISASRKIVDRIDSDSNGLISTEELTAWIKRVQKRYVYENVARVWKDYDVNNDNHISWEEYKQATYGYYLGEWTLTTTNGLGNYLKEL